MSDSFTYCVTSFSFQLNLRCCVYKSSKSFLTSPFKQNHSNRRHLLRLGLKRTERLKQKRLYCSIFVKLVFCFWFFIVTSMEPFFWDAFISKPIKTIDVVFWQPLQHIKSNISTNEFFEFFQHSFNGENIWRLWKMPIYSLKSTVLSSFLHSFYCD